MHRFRTGVPWNWYVCYQVVFMVMRILISPINSLQISGKMFSSFIRAVGNMLFFVFCTIYHCRMNGTLARYPLKGLYEKFVPVLQKIYSWLDKLALIAGCDNWGALVAPYLYFDIEKATMTLYKLSKRAKPQHRISITGLARPELAGGYVPDDFQEYGRVVSSAVLPEDRSRVCEAAIRKVVCIFGEIQKKIATSLDDALKDKSPHVPYGVRPMLIDINATLKLAFPRVGKNKIISPPPGRLSLTPVPSTFTKYMARTLNQPESEFRGSPHNWTTTSRSKYFNSTHVATLRDAELKRLSLNLRQLPGGQNSVIAGKEFKKGDPISPIFGHITHESLKERPILDGIVRYGLPHSNVTRDYVEQHGISLVNRADLDHRYNTEEGFSDMTGTETVPPGTTVPSWYTVRLTPSPHCAVLHMRRLVDLIVF